MRRYLLLPLLLISICVNAQKKYTEQDLEKMAANAEKMAEKVMKDPRYKKAMAEEIEVNETEGFPSKNKALMATVPSQPLSKPGMSSYLNNLYTAYKTKMPVGAVAAAQQAGINLGNDPDKMGAAAVSSWYNGAPREAILLGISASMKKPEDPLLLNNLSALLNMGGAPYHSLPILRTLVSQYPNNPMILNNIGQAYTGAGELDSAMVYFARCIKQSPNHPEANNTAGQIEESRGNKEAAAQHFENSLKGGYNDGAAKGLDRQDEPSNRRFSRHIKPPLNQPYFNEFKYKLPRQCQNANEVRYVSQEHEDYRNFIQGLKSAYSQLSFQESRKGEAKLEKLRQAAMKNPLIMLQLKNPIQVAAAKALLEWHLDMQAEFVDHNRLIERLEKRVQDLVAQYEEKRQNIMKEYGEKKSQFDCGEGNGEGCAAIERLSKEECRAIAAMSNAMQAAIATAVADKQQKQLYMARKIFNIETHYGYLACPNKETANAAFYKACANYLNELDRIAGTPILVAGKCEKDDTDPPSKPESDKTHTMECPVDLSIPFVVGKIELNCEKFTFSAGEGLKFKYEKDFGSKQSTLSIGAGLQFEVGRAFGIFSGEVGASAEQSFYIVFDGDNNISDVGLAMQVEVSAGAEASVDTPGDIGKQYLTKEILDQKAEFGYTLGVNSGWTFNDGSISAIAKSIGGVMKK
jgi:tetratricopeptide (TPR) repeat protein